MRARDVYCGASVAGPRHRAEGAANEDAWLGARGDFGTLVVISDGMGSRPRARRGAKMACRAVLRSVRAWQSAGAQGLGELVERIPPIWRALVAPDQPRDCAATCLFALAHPSGAIHVAGMGDGLALIHRRHGVEWVVGPRTDGFTSETEALGDHGSWTLRTTRREEGSAAVLATDGVADDLLPERVGDFVQWIRRDLAPLAPRARRRALRHELMEWPTPHHTDDKTLVVLLPGEKVSA